MGNFLVVISSRSSDSEAKRLFHSGLDAARELKAQTPSRIVETPAARAASFPRRNGSGTAIVSEPGSGSWLLAVGTWFHSDDFSVGQESRLLDRYLDVGATQLGGELEGFFVIVIGDSRTGETVLLTDVMGSCHGYVRTWDRLVVLSSSSLLLASLADFHLDATGCQEFIQGGISYEDRTVYREVRKLNPAVVCRYSEGALKSEERYWSVQNLTPESLDGSRAVDALWRALTRAAKRVTHIAPRTVCDLTGGYDSRALVGAFLETGAPFSTVVSGPDKSRDVIVSAGLAKAVGIAHLHLQLQKEISFSQIREAQSLTDGEYDVVDYAQIFHVHRQLMERFDLSINGSYGGIARALWWEVLAPRIGARQRLDALRLARSRYVLRDVDTMLFLPDIRLDLPRHLAGVIERVNERLSDFPNTFQMDHANLALRIHRWQGRIATSTNQLWPCLSPFGLRTVLETVLQTSTRLRLRSKLVRRMLARYQPRLADFPLAQGYPASPVTWSNLHRFWPVVEHLSGRAYTKLRRTVFGSRPASSASSQTPARLQLWRQEEVRALLNPDAMLSGSLLDPRALRRFLASSQERDFPYGAQWNRLLSLECSLRQLGGRSSAAAKDSAR